LSPLGTQSGQETPSFHRKGKRLYRLTGISWPAEAVIAHIPFYRMGGRRKVKF
jgi:hypothetical protein